MATNDNELTAAQISSDLIDISRGLGKGDPKTAMQNAFYGINYRGTGTAIPANSDHYGLTFFTRPRLNLSYHNVLSDRRLHPLLTEDKYGLKRAIRCMLDPVANKGIMKDIEHITSPLVDPLQCFMPILSDCLISLSGFPDVVVLTFTSEPGIMKEEYSLIDDVHVDYSSYDLTATFKNIAGDPITSIFQTWLIYASSVYSGRMMSYPESVYFNEVDYDTRIYRLVLDPTRTFVQKIMSTGYSFPTSSPLGAAFNFNSEIPTQEENSQISVQFKCGGAVYNDPITIQEYNDIVSLFNPNMRPSIANDHSSPIVGLVNGVYNKVEGYLNLNKGIYHSYSRINPATAELEWYIPKELLE